MLLKTFEGGGGTESTCWCAPGPAVLCVSFPTPIIILETAIALLVPAFKPASARCAWLIVLVAPPALAVMQKGIRRPIYLRRYKAITRTRPLQYSLEIDQEDITRQTAKEDARARCISLRLSCAVLNTAIFNVHQAQNKPYSMHDDQPILWLD